MKAYWDKNVNIDELEYDAITRRGGQDLHYIGAGNKPAVGGNKTKAVGKKKAAAPKNYVAPGGKSSIGGGSAASSKKVKELEGELSELRVTAETMEKERDFYFGKLRDIEVLIQNTAGEKSEVAELILKVLYATEEEKIEITDDGQVNITGGEEGEGAVEGEGEGELEAEGEVEAE